MLRARFAPLIGALLFVIGQPGPLPSQPAPRWDIDQPLTSPRVISFETDEGTWMNVDVSPDGRTLVFDLLGEIYTMPVAGVRDGAFARRLTSGQQFAMQPRFSPDGRLIAYITDSDGGHNIWVMNADGGSARQVSRETNRLVNSPAWSPDGEYIFARKHFTQQRSLGAGEIWMYHVSGSGGLQVTERVGWQKDTGEPALSPDGRHLYFSRDVTPGLTFEYNKNPHAQIYAILRRDLVTGEEQRVTGGPGGAITPRLSPDGSRLAFIRRVGLQSTLFLRDLATGEEWPVFDRLDRDLQEAWAIHGVYPQYAWLPDGGGIVIWGQGRLWRVEPGDAARVTSAGRAASSNTGATANALASATEIPFRVHVERTVQEPLRFAQRVAPDRFDVRMLRHVRTSPDGSSVVYSALGRLYAKRLPDGEPRRLTRDEVTEITPAFSPDGRRIAYATWSDERGGSIRIMNAAGGGGRDVTRIPGHYLEPSFSPDGRWIVYRATGADNHRGVLWGVETGIFVVPSDGSQEPRLVTRAGIEPLFDHTGERIYLRGQRGERTVLYSVDLNGAREIVHFQSENATQLVPSPDGRWLAFAERFNVFVTAFPRTGRAIDIGPRTSAFPAARVSRDAGMYIHWSGDSRRVHWSLGPELFTRDLARTFAFLAEGLAAPDEPETGGVPIGFHVAADAPRGAIALVGARIITMANAGRPATQNATRIPAVIEDGVVVVDGNRIVAVGTEAEVAIPADAERFDVRGRTIMPGFIDVHAHFGGEGAGITAQTSWPLLANLAFGVTTAHDPSNTTDVVFTNSELVRAGVKLGPRLFSTGTILYGAETAFKAIVESHDDALSHLRRMNAVGAFSVKSYNQLRRDARQMIIKAGHDTRTMVVPEGGSLYYQNITQIIDGHTGIEHNIPVPVLYRDALELFARSGAGYTPTMVVGFGGLSGEYYWYQHTRVWENERLQRFVPRSVYYPRSRRREMAEADDFNHIHIARAARALHDAGGLVNLGAHGQLQGLAAHWELWMFEQGGMTPLEAIQAATINGARYLGLDADLGSIEPGKLADLVVLERNPLENIRDTESVEYVMVNGRLFDARRLREIGEDASRRKWAREPIMFWQR
jgi:imidazolonepropionase-like amidohydrolase/Tol biopolymer transport system component